MASGSDLGKGRGQEEGGREAGAAGCEKQWGRRPGRAVAPLNPLEVPGSGSAAGHRPLHTSRSLVTAF